MVGRLVKQQQIRLFKQQLYQGNLRLFSSRKAAECTAFLFFFKAKACKKPVILHLVVKPLFGKGVSIRASFKQYLLYRFVLIRLISLS